MPSQDTGPRLTVVSPLQVTVPPAHCQPLQHSLHSPKACYLRQGPIHRAGQGNEGGKRTEKIPKRPTSARRVSSNLFSVHSECLVSCPDVHPPPPPERTPGGLNKLSCRRHLSPFGIPKDPIRLQLLVLL